mmetsp:Transcript_5959/g.11648  ORF Transcript_5959/g.11648 Transcript_5959/m.11648 type:complete len:97 (-) Transcript_5959:392-682(-)
MPWQNAFPGIPTPPAAAATGIHPPEHLPGSRIPRGDGTGAAIAMRTGVINVPIRNCRRIFVRFAGNPHGVTVAAASRRKTTTTSKTDPPGAMPGSP